MTIAQRNTPAPMLRPRSGNTLYRAAAAVLRGHMTGVSPEKVARSLYGKDEQLELMLRAATAPATLTDPAWFGLVGHQIIASQLIQQIVALSAGAAMIEAGVKVDLARVASIVIPGRVYDPTGATAGGWIGEGQAIPLRQPRHRAGTQCWSRESWRCSRPSRGVVEADSIEEFVTMAIREAAATLLDLRMFSTTPADANGPAGILIGATSVTPTTVAAPWAISSDIGALVDALARAGGGLEPVRDLRAKPSGVIENVEAAGLLHRPRIGRAIEGQCHRDRAQQLCQRPRRSAGVFHVDRQHAALRNHDADRHRHRRCGCNAGQEPIPG